MSVRTLLTTKVFVVRDSWNGNIVSSAFVSKYAAEVLKKRLIEKAEKEEKLMGDTPYTQSYYIQELELSYGEPLEF